MKNKETLKKAAVINYKKLYEGEPLTQDVPIDAFKQGAKWQQERMYSKEEENNPCKSIEINYGAIVDVPFGKKHIRFENLTAEQASCLFQVSQASPLGSVRKSTLILTENPNQERSYNEEEVLELLEKIQQQVAIYYLDDKFLFAKEWFEQFKKK